MLLPVIVGLLFVVGAVNAGVDPSNVSSIALPDSLPQHRYNVTHLYFRDALLALNVSYNPRTCRCTFDRPAHKFGYWINEFQLPARLRVFGPNNVIRTVSRNEQIKDIVARVIEATANELGIKIQEIDREQYYTVLRSLTLEPGRHFQGLIPVEVHFRRKPYPQSSFGELVTDRELLWEIYEDGDYAKHAGRTEDLLYRFRHNFRHSLGLGHRADRRSIMFPTNVLGLARSDSFDTIAVHRLLCDRDLRIYAAVLDAGSSSSVVDDDVIVFRPPVRRTGKAFKVSLDGVV